jgi:curved DNA-binding protein CbpA
MEVKNAYFALAKKYHPDRVGVSPDALERKSVEDLFAKITEAHSVLTNESARKEYEATLGLQESGELGGADAGRILESEVSFQKGSVLVRKGDFSGAIEFLQQAIGLYDAEPEYHLLLGWASYRNASKSRDAAGMKMGKGMIEKALLANEKLAQGHFYQGLIAKSEGEIERAKRCFEKTVALDPRHNEANSELRVLNLRRSKDASAGGLKGLFKKKAE